MERFEPTNIEEVDEVLKHFNHFHDDHVAGIEIKFENYKALDEAGASTGSEMRIRQLFSRSTPTLIEKNITNSFTLNFKEVQSFEMLSPLADHGPREGPTWGTLNTYTMPKPLPDALISNGI